MGMPYSPKFNPPILSFCHSLSKLPNVIPAKFHLEWYSCFILSSNQSSNRKGNYLFTIKYGYNRVLSYTRVKQGRFSGL